MLILLTNDDGIQAPGIVAMWRELIKLGEVVVVAPETVQSAAGHGITITAPLLTSQVTIEKLLPMKGFQPGNYVLKIKANDKKANQTVQQQVNFTVN